MNALIAICNIGSHRPFSQIVPYVQQPGEEYPVLAIGREIILPRQLAIQPPLMNVVASYHWSHQSSGEP